MFNGKLILVFLVIILSGCATKPVLVAVPSSECPLKSKWYDIYDVTGYVLTGVDKTQFAGRSYATCIYQKVESEVFSYDVRTWKLYSFNGKLSSDLEKTKNEIETAKHEDARKLEDAKIKAERDECDASPKCLKEEMEEKARSEKMEREWQAKINRACKFFVDDFASKANFKVTRLVFARMVPYYGYESSIYECIVQGDIATPYGSRTEVIKITGNTENGVYEHRKMVYMTIDSI